MCEFIDLRNLKTGKFAQKWRSKCHFEKNTDSEPFTFCWYPFLRFFEENNT